MRDFRNAKAMAQTLRNALAARGLKITISQSLELVAEMFGVADWNTLAARIIRGQTPIAREKVSQPPLPVVGSNSMRHFRPRSRRRCIGPSVSPPSESMNTRHWNIFCSP
jgi:hypothetical protein